MGGLCSPESRAGTPREPLLRVCICQYTNAGETTEGARRARAHSPMTGAVRSIEQPWLLTDCGRWAGLSKAATVTFNLPNAHACTHTHTHTHHQWNYNIFCSTPCMSDCYPVCWGPGLPQGESRVEPVTKPIYRSPETHTAEELLPPSHLIQPRPRQAPAGHALMTSSRLPLSAFRCGCHLKGVRGEISISGVQISALWCVHVLTEGGNEKKKRTSLPPDRIPSPG